MTHNPFHGRPVADIDREADAFAQLAEFYRWQARRDARRARVHRTARWWTPVFRAAIDPKDKR